MAMQLKGHTGSVISYSDGGSEYTSYEYQRSMFDHYVISSISTVGS